MLSIPAAVSVYGPALLALAAALGTAFLCRAKARQPWLRPGLALSCLLGWAALEPLGRLRPVAFAPPPGPATLLVPAAALIGIEALRALRAGRNDRLLSMLAACVVGWWLARALAGPGEGWRVAIVSALLVGLVAAAIRGQAGRALSVALALWGAAASGLLPGWAVAAAVLAAAAAAPLAIRAPAALPSALIAAALAAADLARGRLPHGHLGPADLACLLALAAPFLTALIEPKLGKSRAPLAPILAAAAAIGLAWGLRRVLL